MITGLPRHYNRYRLDEVGINKTFLFDLMEGQELHMAVQSEKNIILQAGNANANLCLLASCRKKIVRI